jgi:hypothetical protein
MEKEHTPMERRAPRWLLVSLALCFVAGVLRAWLVLAHDPLIALANSYDEVRYTACFDLYPERPAEIPPTRNSPEAPYEKYHFIPGASPICYWSSELAFQAFTAAIYRAGEWLGGTSSHSIRWIGALKFSALCVVWLAFTRAWLRRKAHDAALANGLLLPLLFADPANTVYLNTFYAEWTALLAAYALCGLILLEHDSRRSVLRVCLLASAAFVLATSKIQHLLLPLACAVVLLALHWLRARRWSWQGNAVLIGALAGLALQGVQLGRDSEEIRAIDMFNRADVAFMGLLPNARDPAATAARLGVDAECLRFIGKRAWQMDDYPGHACPSLQNVTRRRELIALATEPDMALRLGWNGVLALEPWLAPGLGLVQGGNFARLPDDIPTFSSVLSAAPALRMLVLAVPLVVALAMLCSGAGWRRPRLQLYGILTAVIMLASLTVTLLGDGLADTPKQGHLVLNAALAWWIVLAGLVAVTRPRLARGVNAVDFDQ